MKQKNIKQIATSQGFTIIELIIVIAIMGLMATVLVANYNGTRSKRNLSLAGNELTTNTRKAQSYALSARNVGLNVPAKFYVMQFDSATTNQYQILAVNETYASPPTVVETVTLPLNIVLDMTQGSLRQPVTAVSTTTPSCLQVLFSLPYGRIYMIGSSSPCSIATMLTAVQNPVTLAGYINSTGVVALKDQRSNTVSRMQINGLSGTITAQ